MNDSMRELVILAAIALYKHKGIIPALAYLTRHTGMNVSEAIDIIALYDRFEGAAKMGILH